MLALILLKSCTVVLFHVYLFPCEHVVSRMTLTVGCSSATDSVACGLGSVLYLLSAMCLERVFLWIAKLLTQLECHVDFETYRQSLVVKSAMFQVRK